MVLVRQVLLWGAFALQRLMDVIAGTAQMMGSGLLLINASDPASHGRIQGFTQSLASILRTIFPAVGGAMWSMFLSVGYPVRQWQSLCGGSVTLILLLPQ